ncbi:hypothetical protein SAMN06269185_0698 [Natronoarchaeum philippinense]|uniref:Glycerol dehydrogenase n=1 Tax=Natronoarchaeum philippinense TaxID=558529 RepID=A0A285N7K6_NATPI|nr:hypothetical protein [Natronoarchaeum philippinense]SNZ04847.1 hypothetical protein SAMN06269185_0698 [Natronoarchaeum philippinense]
MSANENGDDQSGAGRREVAYRLFAAEYDDASLEHSESDEERAPNYVVTPTGARVNRLFAVGVLTEIEQVNEEVLRARIVDPTGAFVVYAGQYQPDEMAFLERTDPPAFLAVTGKARTFQPEDSDRVYTSVRPESINEVDAETRDRWIVQTAEQTIERVATMASALEHPERGDELAARLGDGGVDAGLASGVALAIDHYGTTPEYLAAVRDLAVEAAEVVADEREEVSQLSVRPGDGDGSVDPADLAALADAVPGASAMGASASGSDAADASASDPEAATADDASASTEEQDADAAETVPDETSAAETSVDETAPETTEATATTEQATADAEIEEDADAESEPEAEAEPDSAEEQDAEPAAGDDETDAGDDGQLGDFEPGNLGDDADEQAETSDAEPAAETPVGGDDMYEFSEEEREEIEEEYGTEFSTGTEVAEPGEADIETPEPATDDGNVSDDDTEDAASEETDDDAGAEAVEAETTETETSGADAEDDSPTEPSIPDDVSLTDVVVETMREMDDGDGVERGDLIDEVIADTGMTEPDVEDAIEEALMGGRCYEPTDDTLKPI